MIVGFKGCGKSHSLVLGEKMKNLSLYIHIPFCIRKCNYCDFLSAPCDTNTRQQYVETLCCEIEQRAEKFRYKKVDTVFFGGGTPSLLSVGQIKKIMSAIREKFQVLPEAEITLEMNPGTVDREKLECYRSLGINRLSIGLQSASNEELEILGRIHTWETFAETWKMVREVGFTNVNIDLMSALPGQTLDSYEETLRKVLALKPEHISAYSLIIEEGTLFYEWYGEECHENSSLKERKSEQILSGSVEETENKARNRKLPDEVTDRQMYELTKQLLEEQGYYRYEISNYALKGYECKHNIGYWKRKEYLGLGLGAASLLFENFGTECDEEEKSQMKKAGNAHQSRNIRSSNITDLQTYLKTGQEEGTEPAEPASKEQKWASEITEISLTEQMEEFMFLGLRMMEGISPVEFEEQFGKRLQEVYGEQITKLQKQGMLEFCEKTERYALTMRGIDVSNQVFVEFI